jgi:hypothetical protein
VLNRLAGIGASRHHRPRIAVSQSRDLLDAIAAVPTAVWAAASGLASAVASWLIAIRTARADHDRAAASEDATEATERARFRDTLMREVAALRLMIRDGDRQRAALRTRIAALEEDLAVQRATAEILRQWIGYLRARGVSGLPDLPPSVLPPAPPSTH